MLNHETFLEVISRFLSQQSTVDDFCDEFTRRWMKYRDEILARKLNWAEPYDEQLINELNQGKISQGHFSEKYIKLWDIKDPSFHLLIDRIHSACDVFSSVPEADWEINEDQLRDEVSRALVAYNQS